MRRLEFGLLVLVFIMILGNWWFGAPGFCCSEATRPDLYLYPGERTTLYLAVLRSLASEAGRLVRNERREDEVEVKRHLC